MSLATEDDARLKNAAVSTVVQADIPIVSERSMYWGKDATPVGEGHDSAGIANAASRSCRRRQHAQRPYMFR